MNGRLFYLSIPSSALMIQENLNLKLLSCRNINHLPKYLMIYLDREENGQRFQTNYISVDLFITTNGINYKFKSSIVYSNSYKSGHYTSLIKIAGNFFIVMIITYIQFSLMFVAFRIIF